MCHEQEHLGICRCSLQWRQVQPWVSSRTGMGRWEALGRLRFWWDPQGHMQGVSVLCASWHLQLHQINPGSLGLGFLEEAQSRESPMEVTSA